MKINYAFLFLCLIAFCMEQPTLIAQKNAEQDAANLMTALLGETPIEEDLQELCDLYGGRVTGTATNLQSVDWGLKKFRAANVLARKEAFTMPSIWLENAAIAEVSGDANFTPKVVAKHYSKSTPKEGLTANIVDGGYGTSEDFKKLGKAAQGKFVLVEMDLCYDIDGLFKEYVDAKNIEDNAAAAGVAGLIYMSSRPQKLLYRLIASKGVANDLLIIVMGREDAKRCLRVLRNDGNLNFSVTLDITTEGETQSYNVIAEITGSEKPDEYVLIGAHLDSWGLGTGANDNGCNISMMIDIARQMKKLNIQPKRTIRFALWNGEEQGMFGSGAYTTSHEKELDKHIMTLSVDIGSGPIIGFFTGGWPAMHAATEEIVKPFSGLGPFLNIDVPLVGTDNFDFMLEGVPNLVANHRPATYGINYHAESDTYDKVDLAALKVNSAIVAALTLRYANLADEKVTWKRQSPEEIAALIKQHKLEFSMRMLGVYEGWAQGKRGRH